MADEALSSIWLEVEYVRLEDMQITVRLKGDKSDETEKNWFPAIPPQSDGTPAGDATAQRAATDLYDRILDGLDKKKLVLAKIAPRPGNDDRTLYCLAFRFQSGPLSRT